MSKVVIFSTYTPKFFDDFFLGTTQKIFRPPKLFNLFRPKKSFFRLYRPKNCFLALKTSFLDLKNFF